MTRFAASCVVAVLAGGIVGGSTGGRAAISTGAVRDGAPAAARPSGYAPPVEPVSVVRGFEPPPTPYSAGHRGVDLATPSAALVRAAGAGRVAFAGQVAGRGVVVIVHPDGVSTEYEPVAPSVRTGVLVARGQPIGRVRGAHGACAIGRCLHWGARRDGRYFDPLTLLRPLGVVRLLPWAAPP